MKPKIVLKLVTAALLWSSCTDYLKENNYNQVLPKTAEDYGTLVYAQLSTIETGTTSVTLESYKRAIEKELYADNLNASMNNGKSLKIYYVGDAVLTNMYVLMRGYKEIKDYNIVIDNLQPDDEAARKLRTVARIMRAVAYYNLMRDYCEPWNANTAAQQLGLPLVKTFDMEAQPPRSSLAQTVDFIVSDLQTAIAEQQTDEQLLFTTDVAKAYLARTYFWSEQWEKALDVCNDLLERHPLLSADDYKRMMSTPQSVSGNLILMSGTGYSSTAYKRDITNLRERPVSIEFYKLFAEGTKDVRRMFIDKKLVASKPAFIGARSAEWALMAMECLAHLKRDSEALAWLNTLRANRIAPYTPLTVETLAPVDTHALIKTDAQDKPLTPLMQAILNERRKELFMEGDRWYELKRNGMPEFWVTDGVNKKETKKYLYNFPMQWRDLLINPALQANPGYVYQK